MAKAVTDTAHYAAIADAIRAKNGDTTAVYTPAQMAPAIRAISGGGGVDLSADTVTPEVLLYGYTAHNAAGEPIVGTLVLDDWNKGNLLTNADFVNGLDGWTHYDANNYTTTGSVASDADMGRYLKITRSNISGSAGRWNGWQQRVSVGAGKSYQLSVYLKELTDVAMADSYGLQLMWYNSAGSLISNSLASEGTLSPGTRTEWTLFEATVTAPVNAASVDVQFLIRRNGSLGVARPKLIEVV